MKVWSLGQEDALEEGTATHASILAWRIQWTEEPDGLLSKGSERVRHEWSDSMLVDLSLREITYRVEWEDDAGMQTDWKHIV